MFRFQGLEICGFGGFRRWGFACILGFLEGFGFRGGGFWGFKVW